MTSQANDIFYEPFRWDYHLINFVLNPYADNEDGINLLTKYTNILGGQTFKCENFKDLIYKVESYVNTLNLHKVNINIEINNNIINNIQKAEKNIELTLNSKTATPDIKFINQSAMFNNKYMINLNIDFRRFKQIFQNNNISKENIIFQENWPMPDEILINKNTKILPKKRAHPTYIIGNEVKFNFDISKSFETDHYDICDREFIVKFLDNYPDLKVSHLKSKPFWEMYVTIMSNEIPKKPFGIMKLVHKSKEVDSILESESSKNSQISIFIKNNLNAPFALRVVILPYNYRELAGIIQKYENSIFNKSELIINIEKYLLKVPFYYKPHLIQFLERKNLGWKYDEKFLKVLTIYNLKAFENEHLSENIIKLIRNIKTEDISTIHEINKNLAISKQLHEKRQTLCCGLNYFKNKTNFKQDRMIDTIVEKENSKNFDEYTNLLDKMKFDTKVISFIPERAINYSNLAVNDPNELEIEFMGDYRLAMNQNKPLRNPYIFDDEIPIVKSNIFGNPYSWSKKAKNIPLTDADSIGGDYLAEKMEMRSEFEMLNKDLKPKDEDYLKFNMEYTKDLSRKRKREEGINKVYDINKCDFIEFIDKIEDETQVNSPSKSINSSMKDEKFFVEKTNNLEEEIKTINSFQNLFTKTLNIEVSGLKIKQVIDVDLNIIIDWKFEENFKAYSKEVFSMIKSQRMKLKEIEEYFEGLLNKEGLFYNDNQRKKLLIKLKEICRSYCGNKLITSYIKKKLDEYK